MQWHALEVRLGAERAEAEGAGYRARARGSEFAQAVATESTNPVLTP